MMDMRVYKVKMPASVRGFAVKTTCPDGDFYTAVINEDLGAEATRRALEHEIGHVREDDFSSPEDVSEIERIRHG